MKKILLFLLFLTFSSNIFAQLDREHWFAPMMDRSGQTNPYQSIYMSTNETTPFKVDVYSNNVIIGTVTISKNNPGKYSLTDTALGSTVNRSKIITKLQSDLFKPIGKGIYLKGEKPFFSSLRFSVNQHAEIITSKGTAGIGTEFYATPAPIEANLGNVGFMTSIMATEDGTVITIDNFNPLVKFSDVVTRTNFNITLNKGESYIIDGQIASGGNNMTTNPNKYGFIGAKILSNHPISVTNGNFNGQYVVTSDSSTDILMDQSVPVDKLGKEFVLVKGNGTIYQPGSSNYSQNMEKAFIVATVNGTNIYVNDETMPVNTTPLTAGQPFVISSEKYKGKGGDHYNMYIRSTENIYVFQLLAGADGASGTSQIATGGYNYIPPLSCYLPKEIDEIGLVSENEGYIGGFLSSDGKPTKLNIITEKGATVTVERDQASFVLKPSDGPFDLTGNNNWVTYSISRSDLTGTDSVSGNIKVKSTKAVTAGISAGDGAVGYGGYFAGFSFIPAIIKQEGDCIPGVKLAVTADFTSYLWVKRNSTGGYDPAPGINNTNVYEPGQAGIYAVVIQQGSCPAIQTQDFKFFNCTTYTNVDYEACSTVDVTPAFSLSTQSYNPTTVKIDVAPTKGTAVVGANGIIKYTANPGATGVDTFKFSYCGIDSIPDCENAQATIQINQVIGQDAVLRECATGGIAEYDLRKADVTADTTVTKVFYKSLAGAQNQTASEVISNFDKYISADAFVYVRIVNSKTCVAIQKIELKSKPNPIVQENLYTKIHCDEDDTLIDGNYVVDPAGITPIVFGSAATFTIRYYDSLAKAELGGADQIIGNYQFTAATAKIWIRVESADSCVTVKEIALKLGSKIPLVKNTLDADVCDKGFDDAEVVNLADYLPELTAQTGLATTYYTSLADANNSANAISATPTIVKGTIATFYYVIRNASYCSDIATVNLKLIDGGFASSTIPASITICEGATTIVDAGTAHVAPFKWVDENDPSRVIPNTQKVTLGEGKYYVILTSPNGCEYKQHFEVVGSPKAQLDVTKLNATYCDEDFDNAIKIKFSTDVTPVILLNNSNVFTVTYTNSSGQVLPDNWSFTTNTVVTVKVVSAYCGTVSNTINFRIGNKIPLIKTVETTEVCDDNLDGKFLVNDLSLKYKPLFTNDASATVKFFVKKADAQNPLATNNIDEVTVTNQQLLYVHVSNGTDCSALAELTIKIKVPKKSDILADKTICPEDTTDLDAGPGFDSYEWYNAADATTIIGSGSDITDLPVGKYYVILKGFSPNDCPYKQNVEIKAAELPIIESIEISGSTVKINAKGGKKPYQYAIDGSNYQANSTFTNVSPGLHKAYVVSADNCDPVEKEFSVVEIYNLISPNGDGINDVLDMSLLKYKMNVKFQIIDRAGRLLFEGDTKNNYTWDGKQGGKVLPTSSYWYNMEWQDFETSPPVKYTGWILLKNRNSE